MILAGALFIHRVSQTMQITSVDESTGVETAHNSLAARRSPRACWCIAYSEHFFLARQTKLETT